MLTFGIISTRAEGGSGSQRLIRALGIETGNAIMTFEQRSSFLPSTELALTFCINSTIVKPTHNQKKALETFLIQTRAPLSRAPLKGGKKLVITSAVHVCIPRTTYMYVSLLWCHATASWLSS